MVSCVGSIMSNPFCLTPAQDWADMLLRMYVRWAEKQRYKTRVVEKSMGEEAGIKSASIEIEGRYAYGYLSGEKGTHRIVRQSPFNSKGLRQVVLQHLLSFFHIHELCHRDNSHHASHEVICQYLVFTSYKYKYTLRILMYSKISLFGSRQVFLVWR